MARFYKIPRKLLNPRMIHIYDLVALVVMFYMALTLLPIGKTLDFSAGFGEKSASYLALEQADAQRIFDHSSVSASRLKDLFESTTIQNGGTVYPINENQYYFYQDGKQGYTYYLITFGTDEQEKAQTSADEDLPRGLIAGGIYIGVADDGRIYCDNLDGISGWTNNYVDLSGEADFEVITELLTQTDNITAQEAAQFYTLVQQNILIGYHEDEVWFRSSSEGSCTIYRGTSQGVEKVYTISGSTPTNMMVAFNKMLFYIQDGDLYAYSIEADDYIYFPISTNWADSLGDLRQIAYVKHHDGLIRVYALCSIKSMYADFTGDAAETVDGAHSMDGIDTANYSGIFTTRGENTFTLWYQDIGQIVWRHEEG